MNYASVLSDELALDPEKSYTGHPDCYDSLTELPCHQYFSDRLSLTLADAQRWSESFAVMFIDLDRFKRINDTLGKDVGNAVLKLVSKRIQASLREDDTVTHLGSDEFMVLLSNIDEVEDALQIVRRIMDSLMDPIEVFGHDLVLTSSIGISVYPGDGDSVDTLVKNAGVAMSSAKNDGRNNYRLYAPEISANSSKHLAMEAGLRRALERNEFVLMYQPLVDSSSGKILEVEALLGWQHPDLGLMSAMDFIPLAEDTGLIIPIGKWIMETVCRQIRQWENKGMTHSRIAVNISARQFHHQIFFDELREILISSGVSASSIVIEITESLLMDDSKKAMNLLDSIRDLGIGISLDDFGTGYSSFSYLKRLPITTLKIDRSFIKDLPGSKKDQAIVATVINLAHSLGLVVVAEGIENEQQRAILQLLGCDILQGYHLSRPLPERALRVTEQGWLAVKGEGKAQLSLVAPASDQCMTAGY